jgi:hypothetical protein
MGTRTWSDDQCARAIREGFGHDESTLFPLIPYEQERAMADEDPASIVVYMRSLTPIRDSLPETKTIFPVKYLIRNVPQPLAAPVPPPDLSSPPKAR